MRRFPPDVSVLADAAAATAALVAAVDRVGFSRVASDGAKTIRAAAAKAQAAIQADPAADGLPRPCSALLLPRDGFVTDEARPRSDSLRGSGFPSTSRAPSSAPAYQGSLGFGFPTALGVKVANPDKPVVAITGDGGFMFAAQELATAVQYGIGVVVLVFNNSAYGNVRRDQQQRFDGRVIAADLVNPDFVKFADSFGVAAERVSNPDAFKGALERALLDGAPRLIEITVTEEASPWPFIHPVKPFGV